MSASLEDVQAIDERIEALEQFLDGQPIDVKREQAHLDEGSAERAYWHFGYLMALKDVRRKGSH